MNVPLLEREKNMKRFELYQMYSHFLSIYRLQQNQRNDMYRERKTMRDTDGVDFDVFLDNTPILKYENKEMAERIFSVI